MKARNRLNGGGNTKTSKSKQKKSKKDNSPISYLTSMPIGEEFPLGKDGIRQYITKKEFGRLPNKAKADMKLIQDRAERARDAKANLKNKG